jgi:hypothetical protein
VEGNMDFNEYDELVKANYERNMEILAGFKEHLIAKGLTSKTIKDHLSNIDFYINTFLVNYEVNKAEEGIYSLNMFFSDWFPRKAMWSSGYHVKKTIASLKKFYSYLEDIDLINDLMYKEFLDEIKDKKTVWMALSDGEYREERMNFFNMDEPDDFVFYGEKVDKKSEALNKLMTNIKEFSEKNSWKFLGDTDIFGIKFKDEEEIYFCCILGNAGMEYGINIYRGIKGLVSYFDLLMGNYDLEEEAFASFDSIVIIFEDRKDIYSEDYYLIDYSGVKFRGKKKWPTIRIHEPGLMPEILTIDDEDKIDNITKLMKVLPNITDYLKDNLDKASLMKEGKCLIKVFDGEKEVEEYALNFESYIDKYFGKNVVRTYSDLDIKRVLKKCKRTDDLWELDISYLIYTVAEEEKEGIFYPLNMIIADVKTEMIVGHHMEHPDNPEYFQNVFLNLLNEYGTIPKAIIYRPNSNIGYMIDLLNKLNIEIREVKNLHIIPEIKKELYEY